MHEYMDDDKVEIVYEPGTVGLTLKHGPIHITVSFSPEQAQQLAASLLVNAREAKKVEVQ